VLKSGNFQNDLTFCSVGILRNTTVSL